MAIKPLLPGCGMISIVLLLFAIEQSSCRGLPPCSGTLVAIKAHPVQVKRAVLLGSSALLAYFGHSMMEKSPVPALPNKTQAYGDQMALEGHTSNIWKPAATLYTFVVFLASLASILTGCSMATLPAYYGLGMIVFYLWHLSAHWTNGEMNAIHMDHHKKEFKHNDFYGDKSGAISKRFPNLGDRPPTLLDLLDPRYTMTSTWAHEGPLAVAVVVLICGGYSVGGTPVDALGFVLAGYTTMAFLGSALHTSFHVRNFELEPYDWYRELRSLHYIHHLRRRNFAMVNMDMDHLVGTLQVATSHEGPGHLQI